MSESTQKMEEQNSPLEPLSELLGQGPLAGTLLQVILARGPSMPYWWDYFREHVWLMMSAWKLPMGGARDGRGLSTAVLRRNLPHLLDAVRMRPRTFGLVIAGVWVHCSKPLEQAAVSLARAHGLPTLDLDERRRIEPEEWPVDWKPGQLDGLARELVAQANVPYEQAKLMLFMVCAQEARPQPALPAQPAEGAMEGATAALGSERLVRFLQELAQLPDEAPEWQELETFAAACQDLVRSRQERRHSRRKLLEEALAELAEPKAQEGLERLPHLQGHERWSADAVRPEELEKVAEQLHRLHHLLAEVVAFFELPPPRNVLEMRERHKRSEQLFANVEQLYTALAQELEPRGEPPSPPSGPSTDSQPGAPAEAPALQIVRAEEPAPAVQPVPPALEAPATEEAPEPASQSPLPLGEGQGEGSAVCTAEHSPGHAGIPSPPALSQGEREHAQPSEYSGSAHEEPPEPAVQAPAVQRLTRHEAAQALLQQPSPESRAAFLFALLTEGDVAGAYWLARALEAESGSSPVPSWLLAALAGASRLQGDSSMLTAGLLHIASTHPSPEEAHLQPLAVAAALPSIIRAPGSGLASWLEETPESHRYLHELIEPVRTFSLYGLHLPADSQVILRGRAERTERIAAARAEVRRWREKVEAQRTSYLPAKLVLEHLLAEGELAELLRAALEDGRGDLEGLERKLLAWRDRAYVEGRADECRRRKEINKNPMVGPAMQWLQLRVEELCGLVAGWHELAVLDEKLSKDYTWVTDQLDELRRRVSAALPGALRMLREHAVEGSALVAAGCATLRRALLRLAEMLSCRPADEELNLPADVALREQLLEVEGGLEPMLERRLLTLPGLRLPAEREQWGSALGSLFDELPREVLSAGGVEPCIEAWVARKDFRFLPLLLKLIAEAPRRQELEERAWLAQEEARRGLKQRLERTRADIEQAVVDGFISDERAELLGRLDGLGADTVLELEGPERVLEGIGRELEAARQRGLEGQREKWRQLQERLPELGWAPEHRELAARRVEEVLAAGSHRSGDELLARLEDCIENGKEFDAALFAAPHQEKRHLEDFLQVLPRWEQELRSIRGRELPRRLQELPGEHAEGARDLRLLYESWQALVSARTHPERVPELLVCLLRQLGWQVEGSPMEDCRQLGREPHPLYQVSASSQRQSPVPHFGSRVEGRLRVLCVWVQEGREVLAQALQQVKSEGEGTLVLYLDRLGLLRRRQLCALSRQSRAAALVLDEWLWLYLARLEQGGERLHALFACGLPFTAINPYIPRAGAVPPEMFFGREEMARRLASLEGTCLVYGGRQLGKSTLLEQVRRRFMEEDPGRHFAVYLDIKNVGDPVGDQPPEQLWPRLREELKRVHFLPSQVSTDKPDDLVRRMGEGLGGERGRKLLILLDEADHFLDADSKRGFEQVKRLRDLMSRHAGLCKVVLAGLHNVQRFQGIANQPLAHFGSALQVGPLEARDADALVRQPLEALGFRLPAEEKNGSVLRILSYTNYHPGLIQLFCRELVALLQQADSRQYPPYLLREADVEAVYHRYETRQLIRERFEWTLALDSRYQATVWSLIVAQQDGRNGFGQSSSTSAILSQARIFWPQGFEGVESEQMRGLLEEMVGLGVLVRNGRGEYRLRSPNVVRLLGSISDIWDKLGELEKKPAPVAFDADNHHVRLGSDVPPRFSPLTFAQERALLSEPRASVVLLVGSQATHVEELQEALQRSLVHPERPGHGALLRVPEELRKPRELRVWLRDSFQEQGAERVLFLRELSAAEAGEGGLVEAALEFCEQAQRFKRRQARVVFILRPEAAWAWLTGAGTQRPELEDKLLVLKRWTRPALDRLFEEADIRTADEDFRRRVLERTTGGWPCLLRHFALECRKHQNERRVAEQMEEELRAGGPLATALWEALELGGLPRVVDVLKLIRDMEGASLATTFEGVLDGELGPLTGRSEIMLELLQKLGCLESRGGKLHVERRVAEALPI